MTADLHPFATLSPEVVIDAIESSGRISDLRVFALNSYENRVYQIGIEGSEPLIAKFYRPERWSDEQILEEHRFSIELADNELPVIAPLANDAGETLLRHGAFRFALFPRRGGSAPELSDFDTLEMLGRLMARLHAIGELRPFVERPALDAQSFGYASVELILSRCIPSDLRIPYESLCRDLLPRIEAKLRDLDPLYIRTHGDAHVGNILSRDGQWAFVDLDDSRMAPAIQDLWMMLSGERHERGAQLSALLEGYNEFRDFPLKEIGLIEALRTLRIMHFAGWLALRWDDPAFPLAFPWFGQPRFWSDHILELREQMAALDEPALQVY